MFVSRSFCKYFRNFDNFTLFKHPRTHGQFVNARYARFTNSNPSSGFASARIWIFDLTPFNQKTGHLSLCVCQDPQKLIKAMTLLIESTFIYIRGSSIEKTQILVRHYDR